MAPTALVTRRGRGLTAKAAVAIALGVGGLALLVVVALVAAVGGLEQDCGGGSPVFGPSQQARNGIPENYLELYVAAGEEYGIPWEVLAGIGRVETDHGQLEAPGVGSGTNFAGAAGPMQFLAATWEQYGVDGDGDGNRDLYDPRDAVAGAANYLRASGAPGDMEGAIFAYNHAGWYVADVTRWATAYKGTPTGDLVAGGSGSCQGAGPISIGQANARAVLGEPDIILTPVQRSDIENGLIDPRVLGTLDHIAQEHTVTVTALSSDHDPGTNHEPGRAVDIGAIDGEPCDGSRSGKCGRVALELGRVEGDMRSTELIYCFDPDGAANADGFARSDHCDHIHVGWDA